MSAVNSCDIGVVHLCARQGPRQTASPLQQESRVHGSYRADSFYMRGLFPMSQTSQPMFETMPSRRMLCATISVLAAAIFQASVPSIAMAQGLPAAGVVTQG